MDIKYYCTNCQDVFELDEVRDDYDYSTNYHDTKCPHCDSRFIEEASKCEICGEYIATDDLTDGICETCLNDFDIDDAVAVGEIVANDNDCVNPFLLDVLGNQVVNELLKNAYKAIHMRHDDKIAKEFLLNPNYIEAYTFYLKQRG